MDNEKHYLPKVLRKRGCYQNGNSHFCTIKRYDCLVGDQNDHQLNLLCYGWVVSGQFVHLPLFTVAWHNVKSRSSVTHKVFLVNDALCHSPDQLAILTSWYWVRRSPCVDFLPPSGGVFRLSHLGVIAVYPMQTVFLFSRCGAGFGNKKIATQQPEPDHPFRDGLGSGSLCSDKKVKNLLRLLREPSWNSK